ncbi:MAG: RHS repeat-associated core domain-containing protein, partial [Candidatus Sulfotelmatobacter sp.]
MTLPTLALDPFSRCTRAADTTSTRPGVNFQNAYTYDAASNRNSLTAPDGSISTYGYDTLNRLNGLANSWAGSFSFGYDALSRRTQLTRPNGITTNYSYDSLSHLLSVLHQAGANTLDGASYTYDPSGNRISKANYLNGITSNYTYDPLYELTQVTQGSSTTESYTYDAVGNRLSSSAVPTYSYNSANELTSSSAGGYTYDANGNTLSDPSGKQYTWDFENRLTQVVNPGVGTTTFRYDPFGRRIQKSGPLGTTNFLYDVVFDRLLKYNGWNVIEEVDNSGNVLARYTHGHAMDQTFAELRSGTTSYIEQDGIGSVTSLSNPAAALANTYTYDSFGNLTASSGSLTNPFRYTAREFDQETGIYEYRARYFDPIVGRFISEDPMGFDAGNNFYAYVNNRPLNMADPLGLSTIVYDPNGWLYLYDVNVNLLGVCPAANNTTSTSIGSWPAGSYPYLYHNNHPPDPNGPYGSYGIYVFARPGCQGCGVHSGR